MKKMQLTGVALLCLAITMVSCSGDDGERGPVGPAGPQGEQGVQGPAGPAGADGANGVDGQDGVDGMDGQDKPNMDFYFQDGFKGYDGTQDAQISAFLGDDNGTTANLLFADGTPENESYIVMRFDGISQIVTGSLVGEGVNCADAFYLNQAILYMYVENYQADVNSLYFRLGFYNSQDPLFDQEAATWKDANFNEPWAGGNGGVSSTWVGPYLDTDDYAVGYPYTGESTSMPGWFAIPLPRSMVNEWICNADSNKGFRIRLFGEGGTFGQVRIVSSDGNIEDFRPVLVLQTEKIDLGAKSTNSNSKVKDWDNMTYEEQMAPLFNFLEIKNH